jgi:hypothetical protein
LQVRLVRISRHGGEGRGFSPAVARPCDCSPPSPPARPRGLGAARKARKRRLNAPTSAGLKPRPFSAPGQAPQVGEKSFLADNLSGQGPPASWVPSLRFAQNALLLLLLASNLCKFARKTRMICSFKKSDVLCFQPLLSFVPTIFNFLRVPASPNSQSRSVSSSGRDAPPRSPTTMCPQKDH